MYLGAVGKSSRLLPLAAWYSLILPVAAVGVAWLVASPESSLELVGQVALGAPVTGWAKAADRRGGHLLLTTAGSKMHWLALADGRLTAGTMALPDDVVGAREMLLLPADHDGDELVDVVATGLAPAAAFWHSMAARAAGSMPLHRSGLCVQRGSGFELGAVGVLPLRGPWGPVPPPRAVVGTRAYALRTRPTSRGVCEVWDEDSSRRREGLRGHLVDVGPVRGAGGDEILTAEVPAEDGHDVWLRLYTSDRGRFHEAWRYHLLDGWLPAFDARPWRFLAALTDLDGDGSCEVVCAERQTGQVTVFASLRHDSN